MTENPKTERVLAAILLLVCLGLLRLEATSPAAARRRRGLPVLAWLTLESGPGGPAREAVYFLSYSWKSRTLHALYVPPSIPPESVKAVLARALGNAIRPRQQYPRTAVPGICFRTRKIPRVQLSQEMFLGRGRGQPSQEDASGGALGGGFALDWRTDSSAAGAPEGLKSWIAGWPRDPRFWIRLPRAARALRARMQPPLSAYDTLLLALEAYRLAPESIHLIQLSQMHTLPRLTQVLFDRTPLEGPPGPVTVEVRNASGEAGVALSTTKILRWEGFDVLEFGNAPEIEPVSRFIDRTGRVQTAELAARGLGCDGAEVLTQIETERRAMVTVVLGRDISSCRRLAPAAGDKTGRQSP